MIVLKTRHVLMVAFLSCCFSILYPNKVQSSSLGVPNQAWKFISENVSAAWSSSCKSKTPVLIACSIADDGKIYEPSIMTPSGNDQFDAECLEALCSLSPVTQNRGNSTTNLQHCEFSFGAAAGDTLFRPTATYDGTDVRDYLRTHPQPSDGKAFVVVHRIPLSVLSRYPKLFTKEELSRSSNLIEITYWKNEAKPQYVQAIGNLYAYWNPVFGKANQSKEEIIDWAKGADQAAR